MPLHIGRVDAEVEVMRAVDTAGPAPTTEATPATGAAQAAGIDVERLRGIVLQILNEELASFQRQQG